MEIVEILRVADLQVIQSIHGIPVCPYIQILETETS